MSTSLQTASQLADPTFFERWSVVALVLLLLAIPLGLSNHPLAAGLSGLLLIVIYFFPGYLISAVWNTVPTGIGLALSPVIGILCLTNLYDVLARASLERYFLYLAAVLSLAGVALFIIRSRRKLMTCSLEGCRAVIAGGLVTLCVAPVYWGSGRFSNGEFVFRGPTGQDPLFHVALLQRLLYHVPPDNVIVSGLRQSVYHYFNDLTLTVILRAQHSLAHVPLPDVFDLYYRCYPTLVYFLLGVLTYYAGRQIACSVKSGVLGVLLLLGGGGLGWTVGALQTLLHAPHLTAVSERLFSSWATWDGVDGILPLVHRPANYMGLLVGLAAVNILLRPERTRSHWILAGLLLGLMAGFNYTLAVGFGVSAVLGTLLFLLRQRHDEAGHLARLSLCIFAGSLPFNAAMVFSGPSGRTVGFPFSGPNLDYPMSVWGGWLGRILPAALIPLGALLVFPIFAYGMRLAGVGSVARLDLGELRHRGLAMVLALTFAITFVIGTFFSLQGVGVGYIFLQPTLWILSLFALRPVAAWMERDKNRWRALAVWAVLGLTLAQALLSYNFCYKVAFQRETLRVLRDLRSVSSPEDVVAYLPSDIMHVGVLGYSQGSTNFSIIAMTGLEGYFLSRSYTIIGSSAGIVGRTREEVQDKADRLYEQRLSDVKSFLKGDVDGRASAQLRNDHVRWIVLLADSATPVSPSIIPWRKAPEIAVYQVGPRER